MKVLLAAILGAFSLAATPVLAQTAYPSGRPITMILPFAAGSGTDVAARTLTAAMSEELNGATFVIDNRAGANGLIGASAAAKAAPDGYTLFFTTNTTHSVNPYIYKTLPYDPNADFVPVGLVGETSPALLVSGKNPVTSVNDVIEQAKAKPGSLNFATTNTSSLAATQLFEKIADVKVVSVNYKAAPQALTDLMGGSIDYFFGDLASGGALVRSGNLKAIAVLNNRRLPGFDQVPTMSEVGVPGLEIQIWIGLFAPKGAPPEIVAALNKALVAAQGKKSVVDILAAGAVNTRATTPAEFAAYVKQQYERWGKLSKEINLQVE